MLDGFPRTLPQAEALSGALGEMGMALDAVIAIEVPRDVLMGRLTSRRQCRECGKIYNVMGEMPAQDGVCDACGGEVYQRDDDTVEAATKRLDDYDAVTSQLVPYYTEQGIAAVQSTAIGLSTMCSQTFVLRLRGSRTR